MGIEVLTEYYGESGIGGTASLVQESTAQSSYDGFMKESKIFLASAGPDLENSKTKHAETKQALLDATDAAKAAIENLDGETKYKNETVDPKCVKTGYRVSFADEGEPQRTARQVPQERVL